MGTDLKLDEYQILMAAIPFINMDQKTHNRVCFKVGPGSGKGSVFHLLAIYITNLYPEKTIYFVTCENDLCTRMKSELALREPVHSYTVVTAKRLHLCQKFDVYGIDECEATIAVDLVATQKQKTLETYHLVDSLMLHW